MSEATHVGGSDSRKLGQEPCADKAFEANLSNRCEHMLAKSQVPEIPRSPKTVLPSGSENSDM